MKILEEIRSENDILKKENSKLKKQLDTKKVITDIADIDDTITINYTCYNTLGVTTYNNSLTISWKILFVLIAPDFITASSISKANTITNRCMKRFKNSSASSFEINHNDFNTIKIQFDTLGLISSFTAQSTTWGYMEFIQLTKKGKELLRVIRKQQNPISS